MSAAFLVGAVMLEALVLYGLLGGADFGGGILGAFAAGPRARAQREAIEQAIGPIWEANHVWLIVVIVLLFSCFPPAFAAVCIGAFVPLVLLLIGIVLRGAAFTFRTYYTPDDPVQRRWGVVFSVASMLAPLMLGVVVGTLASGGLQFTGGVLAVGYFAWLTPFPVVVGFFAAALFAFLAAVYLTVETDGELRDDFRARALVAGAVVFLLALAAAVASYTQAPRILAGLTSRAWSVPLHLATAAAAITVFVALWKRRFRLARLAAAAQVGLIVVGWGAAQYPYLIVDDFTLASASGAVRTQTLVLYALAAGAFVLFPSLYLLFRVFKGERPFAVVDKR